MARVQTFITRKMGTVVQLCVQHGVRNLDLFGSATAESFDPDASDLDFLVEFLELTPVEHADAFFGLMEDLTKTFGRPVDLVEKRTIRNPYFQQTIKQNVVNLYDAD